MDLNDYDFAYVSTDKLTEAFIELGEARGGPKVPLKLIPVVEGSKMTITLGSGTDYFSDELRDQSVSPLPQLLLKSFWANEAVFQLMILSYNLFLLFKFDLLSTSEYRQKIIDLKF